MKAVPLSNDSSPGLAMLAHARSAPPPREADARNRRKVGRSTKGSGGGGGGGGGLTHALATCPHPHHPPRAS